MKSLSRFSVEHSLFVNLLSLFMIAAGILSLFALRREAFPNVSYDIVMVRTDYFGAPPEEVEKLVTIALEDELKEVNGIDEMTSVSSENISLIVLQIDPDEKDKRKIVNDIQRAVDRVDDLPEDAKDPIVDELQTKNMPVINVSLSGDMPEIELQKIARKLELRFLDLQDVAKIERIGWRDREMWVEVNPKIVEDYKLSLEDVILALHHQNLNLPGGTLHARNSDYLVRTIGEFETADQIRNVIIRANDLGNWIRVSDVAEVQDTFEDDDVVEKTFGKPAITLTVVKKERGDIIRLVEEVKRAASELQAETGDKLTISYFDDFSFYVKRRLDVLTSNGLIGIVLVTICLLIFMNRTMAIMTVIGIPIAVMMTFFMMQSMGLTINLMTMFGLIMVMGMIVDDAIVISENIYRHVEKGVAPRQAAIIGAEEVTLPVVSTVLTTIVAFVPLLFMSGIIGKYIWSIPVIVIIALSASLFQALIILPSHMADFVKPHRVQVKPKHNRWVETLQDKYSRTLQWVILHRYKALGGFAGFFIGTILLFVFGMKFILFPQGMIEEFFIRAKAPIGTSLKEMDRRLTIVEKAVMELSDRELENFVTQVGLMREALDDPYTDRGSHIGQLHVFLTPETTAGRRNADTIIQEIRDKTEAHKGLFEQLTFEKVRAGPPVGKPVSIRLRGDDFPVLEKAAEKIKEKLAGIDGVKDISDDYEMGKSELRINVDEEKAARAYLSVSLIANSVRNAIEGGVATKIRKTDEEIEVIVRYPEAARSSWEIFDSIQIPNTLGNLVPLKKVADLEESVGVHAVKHFDRKRMINVMADVEEKKVTPIEIERKMQQFFRESLIEEFPDIAFSFGGEQEETQKSMRDFIRALILAVFLIFIILAANFNSVIRPLLIMSAIPFGLVGVIIAFFLHGEPLSFMALLGVIGLSGVVVNGAIVLVDFVQAHRQSGLDRYESIVQASRIRLRPVMLTTITTVLGLMPVAYGIGGGDPFLKPMALAISWGLAFSTVLTLFLIPCLYAVSDDVNDKLSNMKKRAKTALETLIST